MSTPGDETNTGCILASDIDAKADKQLLWETIQRIQREMAALKDERQREREEFQAKLGKHKTLTCSGCQSAVEDKRSVWCEDCHGELKFDVKDIMDDAKHINILCRDCTDDDHGKHKRHNYLQKLILSCSADFAEMTKQSKNFDEGWPTSANSLSSHVKDFFVEHFSKSEAISKKCKSRGAFHEYNGKMREIFEKSEKCVKEMRTRVADFVAEIEEYGKEIEDLRNNDEFFIKAEHNSVSVPDSIQSPLPTFCSSMDCSEKPWSPNEKFPYPVSINFAAADYKNLFIFADNQLYHADLTNSTITLLPKHNSELFSDISHAKCMLNSSILVISTTQNPKEFVIVDFQKALELQKISVEADIRCIDCSENIIVTSTATWKTLLFSYTEGQCNKMYELQGSSDYAAAKITRNDILAYTNAECFMTLHNAKENKVVGDRGYGAQNISINSDGNLLVTENGGSYLRFFKVPNVSSDILYHKHNYGRLLNPITDDNRSFLFEENNSYTIATFNYDANQKPSFLFDFQFNADPFPESFAFLRTSGVQHLQFVTKDGVLTRYRSDEANSRWIKI